MFKKLERSQEFYPRHFGSPDAITQHYRTAQGRFGGTGTVPSFKHQSPISYDGKRNSIETVNLVFYLWTDSQLKYLSQINRTLGCGRKTNGKKG
jgi:hypothetical protein